MINIKIIILLYKWLIKNYYIVMIIINEWWYKNQLIYNIWLFNKFIINL